MSIRDFKRAIREVLEDAGITVEADIVTPDMEDTSYDLYQLNELEEMLDDE